MDLKNKIVLLGSSSPRRKQLLEEMGVSFQLVKISTDENFDESMDLKKVACFLAEKKSLAFSETINKNEILLTADTTVVLQDKILNKPSDKDEAFTMIRLLSNRTHQVITGVCLRSSNKISTFQSVTEVTFKSLTDEVIHYYIENYAPYDKAGAYGIQEWIGLIGIKEIKGSYNNVVGLPTEMLYDALLEH